MLKALFGITLAGIVALWWISNSSGERNTTPDARSGEVATSKVKSERIRFVPVSRPSLASAQAGNAAETDLGTTTNETQEQSSMTPVNAQFDTAIDDHAADGVQEARLRNSLLSGIAELDIGDQAKLETVECSDELCRISIGYTEGNQASQTLHRLLSLEPLRGEVYATHPDLDGKQNIYVAHGGLALSERLAMNRP